MRFRRTLGFRQVQEGFKGVRGGVCEGSAKSMLSFFWLPNSLLIQNSILNIHFFLILSEGLYMDSEKPF